MRIIKHSLAVWLVSWMFVYYINFEEIVIKILRIFLFLLSTFELICAVVLLLFFCLFLKSWINVYKVNDNSICSWFVMVVAASMQSSVYNSFFFGLSFTWKISFHCETVCISKKKCVLFAPVWCTGSGKFPRIHMWFYDLFSSICH